MSSSTSSTWSLLSKSSTLTSRIWFILNWPSTISCILGTVFTLTFSSLLRLYISLISSPFAEGIAITTSSTWYSSITSGRIFLSPKTLIPWISNPCLLSSSSTIPMIFFPNSGCFWYSLINSSPASPAPTTKTFFLGMISFILYIIAFN
jgi:hypothetical protein